MIASDRKLRFSTCIVKANLVAFAALFIGCYASVLGEVFEVQIEGDARNLDYADFRLWLPPGTAPNRVLVLTLGTNQCGLHLADDKRWQALATSLNAALLTSYFVSPRSVLWGDAGDGSGHALVEGLRRLAVVAAKPSLANSKLYLIGNSQGGVFGYHFAAAYPDRVAAFVSLKGGFHDVQLARKAAAVPGLFIIGQLDLPLRIQDITQTYNAGRRAGAPWCLGIQPNSHHEPGSCSSLFVAFLRAVANVQKVELKDADKREFPGQLSSPVGPSDSWFPDDSFKALWERFQNGEITATADDLSFESHTQQPLAVSSPSAFELAEVNHDSHSLPISCQIASTGYVKWDEAYIPRDRYLRNVTTEKGSAQTKSFRFDFVSQGLPIGVFHGEVPIRFKQQGKLVTGGLDIPLSVQIVGDVAASPSLIYLGLVNPEDIIHKYITITSERNIPIRFLSCDVPDEAKVSVLSCSPKSLSLMYSFKFSPQDSIKLNSASGETFLHVETNREWTIRIPYVGTIIKNDQ